ncbi:hypothetical protein D3C81_2005180 [compost metagenome]
MLVSARYQKASSGQLSGNTIGWVSSKIPGVGSRVHMYAGGTLAATRVLTARDWHSSIDS